MVTHGAGSYGRSLSPLFPERVVAADQAPLARRLQTVLRELQLEVEAALRGVGVPALSLDTATLFTLDGESERFWPDAVRHHLERGRVPLLNGTFVWQEPARFRVLSSDRVTARVALELGAGRVVWVTDVDGVLGGAGEPLRRLSEAEIETLDLAPPAGGDLTGGMRSKVAEAARLARCGIPSILLNGLRPGRLQRALLGQPVESTELV